ncbi:hypothetical protein FJ208_00940, partial [Candidatus Gribaldobacteria bacterium]|nr:hypothetical protein [Candidatus Gribaldobacteria bacterium]
NVEKFFQENIEQYLVDDGFEIDRKGKFEITMSPDDYDIVILACDDSRCHSVEFFRFKEKVPMADLLPLEWHRNYQNEYGARESIRRIKEAIIQAERKRDGGPHGAWRVY